jgi:hypothetical protein
MDHHERQEKKREAMRKLGAQRRRAGELRRRVVATSLVAFALLWAVVFAQMATGNDPVLSTKSAAPATTSRHHAKARKAKAAAVEVEPDGVGPVEAEEREPEPAEAEPEFVEPEAEVEIEEVEPEPEAEEFIEEPAPVVTSQS